MSAAAAPRPHLAATAIAETWSPLDPGAQLVVLAPWCRRFGERESAATWTPVPDPWASPEARRAGESRRRRLEARATEALGAALGAAHGERWSARTARLLLGPWLFSYVVAEIDRWERLALAIRAHPGLTARGLHPDAEATPADTLEAIQWLKADRYNLQLMTPAMAALGIEVERSFAPAAPMPREGATAAAAPWPRRIADALARASLAARGGRAVTLRATHFAPAVQVAMMRRTAFAIAPQPGASAAPPAAADPARRAALARLDLGGGDFERHLARAIAAGLPTCFLEGYRGLTRAAATLGRFPRAVLSGNAWHYDEPFKRWAATAAEAGTTLLGVQHGGNYGIDECSPSEEHETAVTDVFFSWGWTAAAGSRARIVPLPAPKLIGRPRWAPDPARRGILLVTTSMPRFPMQLDWGPERFERYLDRLQRFLAALPEPIARELRVRPHRESMGWPIAERVAAARPGVAIETWQVPFESSIAAARLFVCDHLSTTFAEALATNRPSVLFWEDADTPIRAEAREVLGGLRAAGVLLDDPESAARTVAAAYEDVERWWGDEGRVRAVARYRERYARVVAGGLAVWTEALAQFTRGGAGG